DLPPYPAPPAESAQPLRVKVLKAEPSPPSKDLDAQAHFERGLLHVRLRRYLDATSDFRRAGELDPKPLPWEEVVRAYSEVIERHPQDAEGYHQRAHAREGLGQWKAAIADHSQAIERAPRNLAFLICRGRAYLRTGEKDKALADFRKAGPLEPQQAN